MIEKTISRPAPLDGATVAARDGTQAAVAGGIDGRAAGRRVETRKWAGAIVLAVVAIFIAIRQ
jgi:hypothetical protein